MVKLTKSQCEAALLNWKQSAMRLTFEVTKYLEEFDEPNKSLYANPISVLKNLRDKRVPALMKKAEKLDVGDIDYAFVQKHNKVHDAVQRSWYDAQNKIRMIKVLKS